MLSLNDEQHVEHTRVEVGEVFMLKHVEEVLRDGEVLARMAYVQRAALHRVAVDVVGVGNDCREACYQLHRLSHEVVA